MATGEFGLALDLTFREQGVLPADCFIENSLSAHGAPMIMSILLFLNITDSSEIKYRGEENRFYV